VLDKLEKIGVEGVADELTQGRVDASGDRIRGLGLARKQVDRISEFLALPKGGRRTPLKALKALFREVPSAPEAIRELEFLCDGLDALAIPDDRVALDLSIARGLDYYTGPVFEAVLLDAPEFGSVFGGGRYDGLVERFLGRQIPAVGASIGVDRLFAAMQKLGLIELVPSTAKVIVTVMEQDRIADYQRITRELRQAGVSTELYLGQERTIGKQLQYANRQRIPFAVILGSEEFARDEVTIKNLELGARLQDGKKTALGKDREEWLRLSRTVQTTVSRTQLLGHLRTLLSARDTTPP
jgi:histidyl-tRNA synthetase